MDRATFKGLRIEEIKEIIYEGYVALYNLRIPYQTKHRMFTEMWDLSPDNWRVVGITEAALAEFVENKWNRPKVVCRAHKIERIETSREMFEGPLMKMEAWWRFVTDRDTTVLATKSENMSAAQEVSAFDVPSGLFPSRGFAYRVGPEEKAFLQKIFVDKTKTSC